MKVGKVKEDGTLEVGDVTLQVSTDYAGYNVSLSEEEYELLKEEAESIDSDKAVTLHLTILEDDEENDEGEKVE